MEHVTLGRTGLSVSVAGLGCGGHSRLGQRVGASTEDSVRIVREALLLGITYFDTAHSYGTEDIVGRALEGHRNEAVISTKMQVADDSGVRIDASALRQGVRDSLERLRTESIDVFHLHGVRPADYAYSCSELVPELLAMRDRGEIRFLALSEAFSDDLGHDMLRDAVADDCWDVAMVGFNILNPSARTHVLPHFIASNVGVEVMFAVRNVFSSPAALRQTIADAVERHLVDGGAVDPDDPLGFLVHDGGAASIVEAAYRFARHEPGCHVVLTGTGNLDHLRENIASITKPPLPVEDLNRLGTLFGHLAHMSGN